MGSPGECENSLAVSYGQPVTSAVMFFTGVVGNLFALGLLAMRSKRQSLSLFHVLVTALLMKDLLGTLSVSPLVLTSYITNSSLVGMSGGKGVCVYFGFGMTFLSLATLGNLCAMALERYLSIGHPYFYVRHLSKRCAYITIPLIYLGCLLFCVTPFMGFGSYVQYCPGTWCFLNIYPNSQGGRVYAGLYATFTLIMISITVVCNVCVICQLIMMHRRGRAHRTGTRRPARLRSLSMTDEVEQLLLLVFITVAFGVCSFPLVFRVYANCASRMEEDFSDLVALRMLSFNSIIDPWVFIIFSPSVLRFFWMKTQKPSKKPPSLHEKALTHPSNTGQVQPSHGGAPQT